MAEQTESTETPKARYIGQGQFFDNLAARDYSAEEYRRLEEDERLLIDHSGLWEVRGQKSTKAPEPPAQEG